MCSFRTTSINIYKSLQNEWKSLQCYLNPKWTNKNQWIQKAEKPFYIIIPVSEKLYPVIMSWMQDEKSTGEIGANWPVSNLNWGAKQPYCQRTVHVLSNERCRSCIWDLECGIKIYWLIDYIVFIVFYAVLALFRP